MGIGDNSNKGLVKGKRPDCNALFQNYGMSVSLNYGDFIEVDGHEYVVLKNEDGKAYLSYWMTPDKRVKDLEDKVEMLEERIKRMENEL